MNLMLVQRNKFHILRGEIWLPPMGGRMLKSQPLPNGYHPGDRETFMNPVMREYFRQKLQHWKRELLRESNETIQHLQEESLQEADIADRASLETDRSLELRTRDRERKLISKIDAALRRIDEGSYGYCEETSEPISLRRLEARPIATLSIEAQERHERMERTHRDD
jgi:DnaK suppressor protein